MLKQNGFESIDPMDVKYIVSLPSEIELGFHPSVCTTHLGSKWKIKMKNGQAME